MRRSVDRKLVFRLGGVGFLLDLDNLVEICEQLADDFNPTHSDLEQGIVGSLQFRRTQVPVVDPALILGLKSELRFSEKRALILKGAEGNWALLVDGVEGISSADKFVSCEIPQLLKKSVARCYTRVSLLAGEPMVHFETGCFYGQRPVCACSV